MGGIHASLVPTEAIEYVDAIYLGESESGFAELVADLEAGRLQRTYVGKNLPPDQALRPDRSIFKKYRYEYVSAQTTRGCPMDCSFCSVTAFNGNLFRMRDVNDVVAELRTIPQRDIIFVDDDLNGFSRKAKERCLDLFRTMIAANLGKRWITQVTINFGDDDEMLALARQAGCAGVFIGLESTDTASLQLIRKDGKSQKRGVVYYEDNVARIHRHGIGVVGSFILGIDSQNMETIAPEILAFAERVQLDGMNPTILTPLPGTRDYVRYDQEGRILFKDYPGDWEKYTLAFPVTRMLHVSGAGLMRRYFEVLQFFRPEHVAELYWRTYEKISPDAAWHAFLWNRVWSNYCLRANLFKRSPLAAQYSREIPREPPPPPEAMMEAVGSMGLVG
jgi:radical SAM superfamily enzyme YgiQ (UPF0313 family)